MGLSKNPQTLKCSQIWPETQWLFQKSRFQGMDPAITGVPREITEWKEIHALPKANLEYVSDLIVQPPTWSILGKYFRNGENLLGQLTLSHWRMHLLPLGSNAKHN